MFNQEINDKLVSLARTDFAFIAEMDPLINFSSKDLDAFIIDYNQWASQNSSTYNLYAVNSSSDQTGAFASSNSFMYSIDGCPLFTSHTGLYFMHYNAEITGLNVKGITALMAFIALHKKFNLKVLYNSSSNSIPGPKNSYVATKYETFTISNGTIIPSALTIVDNGIGIAQTIGDYIRGKPALIKTLKHAGGFEKGVHLLPEYLINEVLDDMLDPAEFKSLAAQTSVLLQTYGVENKEFDKICKLIGV